MKDNVIGIEFFVNGRVIKEVLNYYSLKYDEFYIPWVYNMHVPGMIIPSGKKDIDLGPQELRVLAKTSVWELVLHVYEPGANRSEINTYDDFMKSECICCLIYYDCGYLEIYSKDKEHLVEMWNKISQMDIDERSIITDADPIRKEMYP